MCIQQQVCYIHRIRHTRSTLSAERVLLLEPVARFFWFCEIALVLGAFGERFRENARFDGLYTVIFLMCFFPLHPLQYSGSNILYARHTPGRITMH